MPKATTAARIAKTAPPACFTGFADRDARFFTKLARNQSRDWFAANRDEYEEGWLAPMKALLAAVREKLAPRYAHEEIAPPKVFRIYRDVRFSKDKSPYKTHVGGYLGIAGSGAGPSGAAALYFHVGAGELFACAGQYVMDGEQLKRFRAAVDDAKRGPELAKLVAALGRAGFTIDSYERTQRVPRGFDPEHPRAELLRRKGLIVMFPAPARALLTSPKLVDALVAHAKKAVPLVEWLAAVTG
ncbi:MAG: DUF2461 domain-containing protein [Deltaproteobacteria bacterium]|nr:DUF2461 domain-containing protein [Deltaproteobacteria bacterium]